MLYVPKQKITRISVYTFSVCTFLFIVLSGYRIQSDNATNCRVPFYASLETSIQILGAPPLQPVRSSGSGFATHLGKTTFAGNATVDFSIQPAQINGTATFTAANGDRFFTTFSGYTSIISGEAIGNFKHEITGGTGRFANITGTLTGHSVHPLGAPLGSLNFEGVIQY